MRCSDALILCVSLSTPELLANLLCSYVISISLSLEPAAFLWICLYVLLVLVIIVSADWCVCVFVAQATKSI